MSEQIEELLHRRTDLSTFVVHFTRDSETGKTSKDNLLSILKAGKLKAQTPTAWQRALPRSSLMWPTLSKPCASPKRRLSTPG